MLSIDQKKAVFVATKKSYVIATKSFTTSVIYNNQVMNPDNYPYIILNYLDEENPLQKSVGDFIGTDGSKGQRSIAMLSINIYAKDAQGLNANQIVNDIARQLSVDIRQNWKSLSSDTVRFVRKSPTRNLTHVERAANIMDNARMQMDIYLSYNIDW